MKRVLRWVAGVLLCLLLLAAALFIARDRILRVMAERRIYAETGLRANIGSLKTGLGAPTIALQDLRVLNPPDFGKSVLMDLPALYLELDAEQAASSKLHFKVLRVHLAEFNVVRDKAGRMNLEEVGKHLNTRAPTNAASNTGQGGKTFRFGGIDELRLTLNKVRYTDLQQPRNNREFTLGVEDERVTNIRTEEELDTWFKAFLIRLAVQEYVKAREQRGPSREKGLDLLWKWLRQEGRD